MKKYLSLLKSNELFHTIEETELESMLSCLNAETKRLKKNEVVLIAGSRPDYVGTVLEGELHIIKEDLDGNRTIVATVTPGDIFAEALCCAGVPESPVTVIATVDSVIMKLSFDRILHTCPHACTHHTKLIGNMLKVLAQKNLMLQKRMELTSVNSIRIKVLRYLGSFNISKGQPIKIPYNREEMANYLCVERSALSHELSRMKRDGLIDYWKSEFVVK